MQLLSPSDEARRENGCLQRPPAQQTALIDRQRHADVGRDVRGHRPITAHTGVVSEPTQGLKAAGAAKGSETLSQFLARVLDQLSLSAWLPSASLVLMTGIAVSLRGVLDDPKSPAGAIPKIAKSVALLAGSGFGGALLALGAVIVLTMLTQAFAFEAIRLLEGYWGTARWSESLADRRCRHFASVRSALEKRRQVSLESAWASAETQLVAQELERQKNGETFLTPDMLEVLKAAVLGREAIVKLTDKTAVVKALQTPWEPFASPEMIRRRNNLSKRIRDYPEPGRELPTRLGNIMRRFEDRTQERQLEGYVMKVFHTLPLSLQIDHDDQRNRLDLYASMVFVLLFGGVVSAVALITHPMYAVAATALSWMAAILSYRAAMASARAYGGILVTIVEHVNAKEPTPTARD